MTPRRILPALLGGAALLPGVLAYLTVLGVGMHRHAEAWAVALVGTIWVFGPAVLVGAASARQRSERAAGTLALWSLGLLLALPVYFPGERSQALATGLATVGSGHLDHLAAGLAARMPEEPTLARPEPPVALALVDELPPPPTQPLASHEIALPYEGAGRRLSMPIALTEAARELEVSMMLDTGATYTTLSADVLAQLGLHPSTSDPVIELHTANGLREARVMLIDRLWLGDLAVEDVAIATCDACASAENVGLLGLNITSGFNLTIDADRREVVFSRRLSHDRRLDVQPFLEVDATLSHFPGGRTEVSVHAESTARRSIGLASVAIHCEELAWTIDLSEIPARGAAEAVQLLPSHPRCDRYEIQLDAARW